MTVTKLLRAFAKADKQTFLVGDSDAGVIVALDLEGRWFAALGGEVLNRVNLESVAGQSTQACYLNPGGDGLWPAPEGTTLGYQYATDAWRVPPGLCAARFRVIRATGRSVTIRAEVDLVNNRGVGIPALFERRISVSPGRKSVTVRTVESITYVGRTRLRRSECLLAPWSLCQFDCGPGCETVFPCVKKRAVWDLYDEPSDGWQTWGDGMCRAQTDGSQCFQLGIGAEVPWIEFRDPRRGLTVRRTAGPLSPGCAYIDVRDVSPEIAPARRGVRYSVYNDKSGFMEMEAVGGCPAVLSPGETLSVKIATRFAITKNN